MPFTKKETDQLNAAKASVRKLWLAACEEAGVPATSPFVVFENSSEAAKAHNLAMGEYFKLVNRFNRNVTRRERHAAMKDMGLKRVVGALGGVYYE